MADIKWLEGNRIQIAPPKRTKKITGTRFATILGLNPWSTAFEMWCAITKTYEKPFEDTIYTVAGKTIEPKQARYMEQSYGISPPRKSVSCLLTQRCCARFLQLLCVRPSIRSIRTGWAISSVPVPIRKWRVSMLESSAHSVSPLLWSMASLLTTL